MAGLSGRPTSFESRDTVISVRLVISVHSSTREVARDAIFELTLHGDVAEKPQCAKDDARGRRGQCAADSPSTQPIDVVTSPIDAINSPIDVIPHLMRDPARSGSAFLALGPVFRRDDIYWYGLIPYRVQDDVNLARLGRPCYSAAFSATPART